MFCNCSAYFIGKEYIDKKSFLVGELLENKLYSLELCESRIAVEASRMIPFVPVGEMNLSS